jgi:beta-phosphoglucomutase
MSLKACIYDLDGVITDTAHYHFKSWKWVGEQLNYTLTEKQNQKLKGVGRKESLDKIIHWSNAIISEADKQDLLVKKNAMYLELINDMRPTEVFEGFTAFNNTAKKLGLKVGVGSSSRNAPRIIEKLDLKDAFQTIVDGGMTENSKPEPDIFLLAATKLEIEPKDCLVIEDSQAGITAASKANMKCVHYGTDKGIRGADMNISSWLEANLDTFNRLF